jgi:hypothetical protein
MAKYKILSEKQYIGSGVINTADGPVEVGGVYELSDETVGLLDSLVRLEKVENNNETKTATLPVSDSYSMEVVDSDTGEAPTKKPNTKS